MPIRTRRRYCPRVALGRPAWCGSRQSQGFTQLVVGIGLGIENMHCRATEHSPADHAFRSWLEFLPPQLLAKGGRLRVICLDLIIGTVRTRQSDVRNICLADVSS